MSAAEDEFRPALEKFLRANGMSDDTHLTHFIVLGLGVSRSETNDDERFIGIPSDNFPFVYQMGALAYALEHHKSKADLDDDD